MTTKTFCIVLVMIITTLFIPERTYAQEKEQQVFFIVDNMPDYPGGNEALRKDLEQQVKYPEEARMNDINGKVYISFVVDKKGEITNTSIARGVHPLLDKEALRVFNSLEKKWNPGSQEKIITFTMALDFKTDGQVEVLQTSHLTKTESPYEQKETHQVFFIVENMPEYPGGVEALLKDIKKQVKYPAEAQKNKLTGKIYVTFVVDKDGKASNSSIARGVDPILDKEALRVVNDLEKTWKPGSQRGTKVNVSQTVLIDFKADGTIDAQIPPPLDED